MCYFVVHKQIQWLLLWFATAHCCILSLITSAVYASFLLDICLVLGKFSSCYVFKIDLPQECLFAFEIHNQQRELTHYQYLQNHWHLSMGEFIFSLWLIPLRVITEPALFLWAISGSTTSFGKAVLRCLSHTAMKFLMISRTCHLFTSAVEQWFS